MAIGMGLKYLGGERKIGEGLAYEIQVVGMKSNYVIDPQNPTRVAHPYVTLKYTVLNDTHTIVSSVLASSSYIRNVTLTVTDKMMTHVVKSDRDIVFEATVEYKYGGSVVFREATSTATTLGLRELIGSVVQSAERAFVADVPNDEGDHLLFSERRDVNYPVSAYTQSLTLKYRQLGMEAWNDYELTLPESTHDYYNIVNAFVTDTFPNSVAYEWYTVYSITCGTYTETSVDPSQYNTVPRAFANVHLSGAKNGGVAFGKFSGSTDDEPLFECVYPAIFYGGIMGVGDYSLEEVNTGGRWIDGKPIYSRTVAKIGTTYTHQSSVRTITIASGIADIDSVVDVRGVAKFSSTSLNTMPLPFCSPNGAAYDCSLYLGTDGNITVQLGTSRDIYSPVMTFFYTKTTDVATAAVMSLEE